MKDGIMPTTIELATSLTKDNGFVRFAMGIIHLTNDEKVADFFALMAHPDEGSVVLKVDTRNIEDDDFSSNRVLGRDGAEFKTERTVPPEVISISHIVSAVKGSWTDGVKQLKTTNNPFK
jgi:hypothetical protein